MQDFRENCANCPSHEEQGQPGDKAIRSPRGYRLHTDNRRSRVRRGPGGLSSLERTNRFENFFLKIRDQSLWCKIGHDFGGRSENPGATDWTCTYFIFLQPFWKTGGAIKGTPVSRILIYLFPENDFLQPTSVRLNSCRDFGKRPANCKQCTHCGNLGFTYAVLLYDSHGESSIH